MPTTFSKKYSNKVILKTTVGNLQKFGLIRLTRDKQCYRLTSTGKGTLQEMGYEFKDDPRSVVCDTRYIRRKLCADVNVMFHTAGVNVFAETSAEVNQYNACYLPLLNVRSVEKGSSLSCAHMSGIFKSGETAYAVYYMNNEGDGAHVSFEENMINMLIKDMDGVKYTKIIFAGKSLEELWELIFETKVPKRLPNQSTPFAFAYDNFIYNILFFERTRNGALHAQVLAVQDYRKKIAGYFCGGKAELSVSLSYCDGLYKDAPVIVAVDMDLKRLRKAIMQSEAYGQNPPVILCLEFQEKMLNRFLQYYQIQAAQVYVLEFPELTAVLPELNVEEFTNEPVRDKDGGCISVR